jgi:hypothetical protein
MINSTIFYRGTFLALLLCAAEVGAASIYKYRMPDGGTMYTEKPMPKARLVALLKAQDPTPVALSLQRLERERREEQRLYAEIMEERRLEALLATRQSTRHATWCGYPHSWQSALVPRPGERTGTVGGYSRLNDRYWQRLGSSQEYVNGNAIYTD